MKTLGILGGIGPESTVDYYRLILRAYGERSGGRAPSLLINSVDVAVVLDLASSDEKRPKLVAYLASGLERLASGGASLALMASNTPHVVFDELERAVRLPLLSIVDGVRRAAETAGLKRLGILGTKYTMRARFYPEALSRSGIEVFAPGAADQELVHDRYTKELVPGLFRDETRREFAGLIERMAHERRLDAVILAGTELPLLLREARGLAVPLLDSARLHAEEAVGRLLP